MKHRIVVIFLFLSFPLMAKQSGTSTDSTVVSRINITAFGLYGWNTTMQSYGGLDLLGHFPIGRHFEAEAALEAHSGRAVALTAVGRTKFPIRTGEFFFEAALNDRLFTSYRIRELAMAASFGYRMDYVSVQLGILSRNIVDIDRQWTSEDEDVAEPINLLYRLALNLRPSTSRWNVNIGAANFSEYEYCRSWEPIFFLGGHYDINGNLSALARIDLKPSGMFSQTTNFWGAVVRAGVKYTF